MTGPTYLVAHRSEERRNQLARSLTARKVRVRLAADGPRALAMAIAQPPELVIAELSLPGYDGVKLARLMRMRDDLAAVPVLLLSLPVDASSRKRALREDVDEVLTEPVDLEELFLRCQRIKRRSFRAPVTQLTALRGKLEQFGVTSVLGLLELDRKSGLLRVTNEDGRIAILRLRGGEVVNASLADSGVYGADVIYELARWTQGTFAFRQQKEAGDDGEAQIGAVDQPLSMLILEAARRIDEGR